MKFFQSIWVIIAISNYGYCTDKDTSTRPPQKTCHSLTALEKPPGSKPGEGSWRVARVTPMLKSLTNPDENFCSVAHYGPDCGAVHYTKVVRKDGVLEATATCYNKKTKTILRYRKELYSQDPNYHITQGKLRKMERITEDHDITPVPEESITQSMREEHGAMYAVIAIAPHGKWSISRTCDLKNTWVLFPADIPVGTEETFAKTYEKEIDDKLAELKIDKSTLTIVPLTLPFQPPEKSHEEEKDDQLDTELTSQSNHEKQTEIRDGHAADQSLKKDLPSSTPVDLPSEGKLDHELVNPTNGLPPIVPLESLGLADEKEKDIIPAKFSGEEFVHESKGEVVVEKRAPVVRNGH